MSHPRKANRQLTNYRIEQNIADSPAAAPGNPASLTKQTPEFILKSKKGGFLVQTNGNTLFDYIHPAWPAT